MNAKSKKKNDCTANILKHVKPGDTLILGISGGPDSMYLLSNCLELQKKLKLELIIAHVNHSLRGKESDKDEKFIKKYCKKYRLKFENLTIHLKEKDGTKKQNLEEKGRDARYTFFEKLRKKHDAQWILTAHHLNDNIETMLFNLIRGAHFNGLKAMNMVSESRRLLRPLLNIRKEIIMNELRNKKIPFCTDKTNNDTDFSRNHLRKNIIPLFRKINNNFEKTFEKTLKNIAETNDYLEQQYTSWLQHNSEAPTLKNTISINLKKFLDENSSFQKSLLVHLYKTIHGSTKNLTGKHLNEIINILGKNKTNVKKEFGPKTYIHVIWDAAKKNRYIRLTRQK